jgi:benzoyl-CoA reductase/2-hydroxyglutaryl-CoA dehydratase subunit BcrC/BadD/HgdB
MRYPQDIDGVRELAEEMAREHVAAGGKVVGYVTPCVPAELIEAAGMRPMMLSGGTERSTELGDRVMEDLFDRSLRAVFERLLKGEFDYLSAIVLPRANDSAHRMYYYLSELKRLGEAKLPPVLLCDVAATQDEASRKYSVDALGRLWDQLREIGDTNATPAHILGSMAMWNAHVASIQSICYNRHVAAGDAPAGGEMLSVFAASRMLPDQALTGLTNQYPRFHYAVEMVHPRVIICGSAQHDSGLHQLVEKAGGVVVGDYHASGELSVHPMYNLHERRPPLDVLVDMLRGQRAASRRIVDAGRDIREFAKICRADLAIFSYFPEEEALTWDYPEQKAALEARKMRVLRLPEQAWPFDIEAHRDAVTAFVRGGG